MPGQAGRDVDHEIDGYIAKQKESDARGPGMEKNPERTVRQRNLREMPWIQASVGDQRQSRDEEREQNPILARLIRTRALV